VEIGPESLSSLLDNIPEPVLLLSIPDCRILYASPRFLEKGGWRAEEVRGRPCHEVVHRSPLPCDQEAYECPARAAAKTGATARVLHHHPGPGGRERIVEVTAHPLRNEAGEVSCVIEVLKEEAGAAGALDLSRTRFFQRVIEACPEGIIANDRAGNIFLYNEAAERIFGYPAGAVLGQMNVRDLYPPGGAREVMEFLLSEHHGGRGRLVDFETEVVNCRGKRVPIRLCCTLLYEGGREIGTIGFFTDISAKRQLQDQFLESEERFRGVFEAARDGILTVDNEGRIAMANAAAGAILGYRPDELVGTAVAALFPAKYGDPWTEICTYASTPERGGARRTVELAALHRSGREIPIQISVGEKTVRGKKMVTVILRDISERKALEEELRLLSITDSLTGLFNRRHFTSLAQKEVDRAVRNRTPFSVMLIDVDGFKKYNDTFGHAEGDRVLQALGELAAKSFRTMDSVFRFGGEEFIVLLPETCAAGAMVAAERFRIRFSEIVFRPLPQGEPVSLTVSIGVAEYHSGYTLDDLIRFADLAMYAAKNGGRNRTVCYEELLAKAFRVEAAPEPPPDPL